MGMTYRVVGGRPCHGQRTSKLLSVSRYIYYDRVSIYLCTWEWEWKWEWGCVCLLCFSNTTSIFIHNNHGCRFDKALN